jgi:hypothetical protein
MTLPRNAQIWLPGYVRSRAANWLPSTPNGHPRRVWFTIGDHYEPLWAGGPGGRPDDETAQSRVAAWAKRWPAIAARHTDSAGSPPKYTFFFPQEEYRPSFLEPLAEMTRAGVADVEIHIHHNCEGQQNFVDRISGFQETLFGRHGLLRKDAQGRILFGFIHGNWALDNSRPDGRWCGLNNELSLLRDLGCYADFTMPSGSSPTQARTVNTIYWALDDPERPRSYDTGLPVTPGGGASGDLLMIPGPFCIRWAERLTPRLDIGELAWNDSPSAYRIRRWLDVAPQIGSDIFVKLFTHGAQERNIDMLLGGGLEQTYALLSDECRRRGYQLRYATAWEMRQAVDRAATGSPS